MEARVEDVDHVLPRLQKLTQLNDAHPKLEQVSLHCPLARRSNRSSSMCRCLKKSKVYEEGANKPSMIAL